MLFARERELNSLRATTSTLRGHTTALQERIHELTSELARLRGHLSVLDDPDLLASLEQRLALFQTQARQAAEARATVGAAIEAFPAAMRTPPPHGVPAACLALGPRGATWTALSWPNRKDGMLIAKSTNVTPLAVEQGPPKRRALMTEPFFRIRKKEACRT